MRKMLSAIVFVWLFSGCRGNHGQDILNKRQSQTSNNNIKKQKAIDSQMALGDRPDNEQADPTFKGVLNDLLASYNKVIHIDKSFIDGKDTLKLHETYYCLHDSLLSVPKKYMWGGDKTKDFVTNNFVSKIILTVDNDTVLNEVFDKSDFNGVINGQLKKYAIIFNPDYLGYNKIKSELALGYSISIPLTDVGVPTYLVIDKKGKYRILDEYAKMNSYKK